MPHLLGLLGINQVFSLGQPAQAQVPGAVQLPGQQQQQLSAPIVPATPQGMFIPGAGVGFNLQFNDLGTGVQAPDVAAPLEQISPIFPQQRRVDIRRSVVRNQQGRLRSNIRSKIPGQEKSEGRPERKRRLNFSPSRALRRS